jgi:hypothetical protein
MSKPLSHAHRWARISIFNLFLIAVFGATMRYKIAFSFPFVDQRNILHAHSHFAFAGWVTHTLFVLMVTWLSSIRGPVVFSSYRRLINANLFTAYGMLVTFPFFGYGVIPIVLSTLNIFVSYAFAYRFWRDLNRLYEKKPIHKWLKVGLLLNVLSSVGPFTLAIMLATKNLNKELYLSSVYYFLHFQYNGWFLFTCMGLAIHKLLPSIDQKIENRIFLAFTLAFIPTYVLSVLWLRINFWLYLLVIIAAFSQIWAWTMLLRTYFRRAEIIFIPPLAKRLFLLYAIAFSLKLILQLGSTIPSLSHLAYGIRPIIIGYLHLVLLGVFSLFLIGYMISEQLLFISRTAKAGVILFAVAVIINELLLLVQGLADLNFTPLPFLNVLLFFAACLLLTGSFLISISSGKPQT